MLILLDIDGVMVPAKPWISPSQMEDGFYVFDSKAVKALNRVISSCNADIMLTTSHRDKFNLSGWREVFRKRGISVNKLYKFSTNRLNVNRMEEISNWYSSDGVEEFVIIDDDSSLNDLPTYLKNRLVMTKPYIGLTSADADEAIKVLNTALERV